MNRIVTYFYLESRDCISLYGVQEKNYYKKNEYYFRCILNFFISSLNYNKNEAHYFVCNEEENIEFIPNFSFKEFCRKNNIQIIKKDSKYVKKQQKWAGSMYLFDVIEYFSLLQNDGNDNFIFFDNDVLIHDSLKNIVELTKKYKYIAYDISKEYIKDGNWVVDFNNIGKKFILDKEFKPYGGEFLALKGDFLYEFYCLFKSVYSIDEFTTEEHYISYIISKLLIDCSEGLTINNHLRRVWTTLKYNNVNVNDKKLKILHLPSEKQYGLYWLNKNLISNAFDYDKKLALKYVGIDERPLKIKLKLYFSKVIKKIIK